MTVFLLLTFTICVALYLLVLSFHRLFCHPLSKYPGPPLAAISDWYTAFFAARGDLHIQTHRWHVRYGPIVRIGPNFLSFNSQESFHSIYGAHGNVRKTERYAAVSASRRPNTVTAIDKATFMPKRKAHLQLWTERNLKGQEDRLLDKISTFLSILDGPSANNRESEGDPSMWSQAHDLAKECTYLTTDIAMDFTLSENLNLLESDRYRWLSGAMKVASWRAMTCCFQPLVYKLNIDKVLLAPAYKKIRGVTSWAFKHARIHEKEFGDAHNTDLLHTMVDAGNVKGDKGFDTKDLWLETLIMLGVGAATTGPTMSSILFYLLHTPSALSRVAAEIRRTFSSEDEIRLGSKLNSCSYLKACIDETLRLVPVLANVLPREVLAGGIVLEGEYIPEGTVIGTSIYALHRNEKYFTDANLFRPERWLEGDDSESLQLARRAFNPFSTGPRFCVGWRLAMAELNLTVARTVYSYDMRLPSDAPCCKRATGDGMCKERKFESYVGIKVEGPVAEFRRRVD